MTFEKICVATGRSTSAGLVLDQYWTVTIQKELGL